MQMGEDPLTVSSGMRIENGGLRIRGVFDVPGIRKRCEKTLDHRTLCRTRNGAAQIAKRQLLSTKAFELGLERGIHFLPVCWSALGQRLCQSQAIVEPQQ